MRLLFLISANFIFYITFVQFGLLRMINARFGLSLEALGVPLGIMAIAGATTSVLAGYLLDRFSVSLKKIFNTACVLSVMEGIVALFAVNVYDQKGLIPLFFVLGLFMGINGVLVIRAVESWPSERRGINAGWTMAVVYLASNIIAGFVVIPENVALINGSLVIVAGTLCLISNVRRPPQSNPLVSMERLNSRFRYLQAITILASLVAVDSFVFHIETNRADIYHFTWENKWLRNGIVHAVAAVTAGIIWDGRGGRPLFQISIMTLSLSLAIFVAFPVGLVTGIVSTFLYNTAVSFYGILLLLAWFAVYSKMGTGLKVGIGMALTGWIASPMGIVVAIKLTSAPIRLLFVGSFIVIFCESYLLFGRRKKGFAQA